MCEKECGKAVENISFATELLREVKASARRWFVAFVIMCIIEIATICGFLWYISLPVETGDSTSYEQNMEDVDGGDMKQIIGDE